MNDYIRYLIRKLVFYTEIILGMIFLIGGLLLAIHYTWFLLLALLGLVFLIHTTYIIKKSQYEHRTRRRHR